MQDEIYFQGKVLKLGSSIAIVIPKENAEYLRVAKGDKIKVRITKAIV